jgi:hypothetical protein
MYCSEASYKICLGLLKTEPNSNDIVEDTLVPMFISRKTGVMKIINKATMTQSSFKKNC